MMCTGSHGPLPGGFNDYDDSDEYDEYDEYDKYDDYDDYDDDEYTCLSTGLGHMCPNPQNGLFQCFESLFISKIF